MAIQSTPDPSCDQIPYVGDDSHRPLPLSKCLEETLPIDWIQTSGATPYESINPKVGNLATRGDPLFIDGVESPGSDQLLETLFSEEHYVVIPKGSHILESVVNRKRVWDYPVGFKLVHLFIWNDSVPRKIFELRMQMRLPSRMWAYGVYKPAAGIGNTPDILKLDERSDEYRTETVTRRVGVRLKTSEIKYRPIASQGSFTCRGCHADENHVTALYQFGIGKPGAYHLPGKDQPSYAGPCSFTPTNPHLSSWIQDFKKTHDGESPIELFRK